MAVHTSRSNLMPPGPPLLQVHYRRSLSGMIAGVAFILVVGGGLALLRAGAEVPQPVQWVAWSILALMLYGILVGVRQLMTPPLMFIANNEGIVTYYLSDHNTYTGTGALIPWANISSIALERRRGVTSSGKMADVWVIACTLNANAEFDVEKHSSGYLASDAQRVICLDAFTGTIRREELLDRLRLLWQDKVIRERI